MSQRFEASRSVAALKRGRRAAVWVFVTVFCVGVLLAFGSGRERGGSRSAGDRYAFWEASSLTWGLSETVSMVDEPVINVVRYEDGQPVFADGVCALRLSEWYRNRRSVLGIDVQRSTWVLNYVEQQDWASLRFLPLDALPEEEQLLERVCASDLIAALPRGTRRQDSASTQSLLSHMKPAGPAWRLREYSVRPMALIRAVVVILTISALVVVLPLCMYAYSAGFVEIVGCVHCEYDRTGIDPDAPCPECGHVQVRR